MNEKRFIKSGYNITTDPQFQNKRYGITPELSKQFEPLFIECQEKPSPKLIDKLTKLVIQYPTVPQLKNYLSVAYHFLGNHKKAVEVNNWLLSEHPDYLFGKLNEANTCIDNGDYDQVPEILGGAMEIKQLYPGRDLFHLAEVTGYFKVIIRYFAAIENLELAENRLKILKKIAPGHPDTEDAETFLFSLRLKASAARFAEEREQAIIPKSIKTASISNKKNVPTFNHPEIHNLYKFGLDIPHEKLHEILALPRASLINDLENMLLDAINRYGYFNELDWEESSHSFVLHSLFLLKEMNAVESLPNIFSFLEYDYDFLDFWLGDHKTDTLWQCFYGLGFSNTPALKQFLLQPGIDTYIKTAVSEALCQIALHCPERRDEILSVYSGVFTYFSQADVDDNIIDSDFLGLAIGDAVDCNLHELLPVIKILYDKNYAALGINGNYEDVEEELTQTSKRNYKKDLYTIFELYDYVLNNWAGYVEDGNSSSFEPKYNQPTVSNKIGRNEPCPCGSGKKYKKCCLNKI